MTGGLPRNFDEMFVACFMEVAVYDSIINAYFCCSKLFLKSLKHFLQ